MKTIITLLTKLLAWLKLYSEKQDFDAEAILAHLADAYADEGSQYLSMLAAAYAKHCNLPPEEVALVRVVDHEKAIYYFARIDEVFHPDLDEK